MNCTIDGKFDDQENYRKLTEPFATAAEAEEACTNFLEEAYELRNKYRIHDIVYVIQISVKYEDGTVGSPVVFGSFGDEEKVESLAGFAYGMAAGRRQERIAKIIETTSKSVKGRGSRK